MGRAFIIFDKQTQAENMIWIFKTYWMVRIFHSIIKCFGCKNMCKDRRWWEDQHIEVKRAAEPTDIFWENLAVNRSRKFKYKLLTWIISALLLGIVFVVNLILNRVIKYLEDDSNHKSNGLNWLIRFISLGNSILIASINLVLRVIMRALTSKERDSTYTDYNLSVAYKLFIVMFANTSIIPLVTHLSKDEWFGSGGLVINMYMNVVIINFFSPIFYYFNFTYFYKKFRI